MTNRLVGALSPYLLQHADNPVDWYPWGEEAFSVARRRDVPVLLSVGYAACHWCHVMAHESFESEEIAEQVNRDFVAVKVDREEHPDVDAVYMRATQMLTGRGGWPMTVFLDHDRRPFYAGTYFPPADRHGLPGLPRVLASLAAVWRGDRDSVMTQAQRLTDAIRAADGGESAPRGRFPGADHLSGIGMGETDGRGLSAELRDWTDRARRRLQQQFDGQWGGFGGAPKFPQPMVGEFLLRHHARTGSPEALAMVSTTAEQMARGGMYDQVAGGFARYSVDATWTVPHFEKMLYDNALLLSLYLHCWRSTGDGLARRVADQTADFLLRDLCTAEGGFAASLDADSDPIRPGQGREGAYYTWDAEQLAEALGEQDARWAADVFGVTTRGSFEDGMSVLTLRRDPEDSDRLMGVRDRLAQARSRRPAPPRDDKVVAAWNGWAIRALAEAGLILRRPDLIAAAVEAAGLLWRLHWDGEFLARVSRDGRLGEANRGTPGTLVDYAAVAEGFLGVCQATGDAVWLQRAGTLLEVVAEHFTDGQGGFFDTDDRVPGLITRPRETADNATPSGWTSAVTALLTHSALTGDIDMRAAAERGLRGLVAHPAAREPLFAGQALAVAEAWSAGPLEVAVVGPPGPQRDDLVYIAAMGTSPGLVCVAGEPTGIDPHGSAVAAGLGGPSDPGDAPGARVPLLADRVDADGAAQAYVCHDFSCQAPTSDPQVLAASVGARANVIE